MRPRISSSVSVDAARMPMAVAMHLQRSSTPRRALEPRQSVEQALEDYSQLVEGPQTGPTERQLARSSTIDTVCVCVVQHGCESRTDRAGCVGQRPGSARPP